MVSNKSSEYPGLYGRLLRVLTGNDRETDNDTLDFYCKLESPTLPYEIERIKSIAEKLYGESKEIGELGLDLIIMSPDMLEPIPDDKTTEYSLELYSVSESWCFDGDGGKYEQFYLSRDLAELKMREFIDVTKGGEIFEWRDKPNFVEESRDGYYCCFLEGDFCSNHYIAKIICRKLPLTLPMIRRF